MSTHFTWSNENGLYYKGKYVGDVGMVDGRPHVRVTEIVDLAIEDIAPGLHIVMLMAHETAESKND